MQSLDKSKTLDDEQTSQKEDVSSIDSASKEAESVSKADSVLDNENVAKVEGASEKVSVPSKKQVPPKKQAPRKTSAANKTRVAKKTSVVKKTPVKRTSPALKVAPKTSERNASSSVVSKKAVSNTVSVQDKRSVQDNSVKNDRATAIESTIQEASVGPQDSISQKVQSDQKITANQKALKPAKAVISKKEQKVDIPVIIDRKEHRDIIARLPTAWSSWPQDKSSCNTAAREPSKVPDKFTKRKLKWPKRPVVFISDPHADATAFEASLIAAGVATQKKAGLQHLKLTKVGRKTEIIIGGDCLDKGPSNLSLLRSVKHLYKLDARVTLLAGNHDLRLLMGLLALQRKKHNIGNQHFFVRMGKKVIPLFKEVFEQYLDGTKWDKNIPDEDTCRKALFPDEKWFKEFPYHAAGILTAEGIEREVHKMHNKASSFEKNCAAEGLSLRHIYAASLHCQKLFLHKKGEFHWFFKKMRLVEKRGSFLFLHAGLDDAMGELLLKNGTTYANKAFHRNLKHMDLFGFYYSSIANTFRTKYRDADLPLTDRGVNAVHKAGIHFVVQGHINRQHGQRIAIKKGLIHIEADITLDECSREREGLDGFGIGATLISKKQGLIGISCDYPTVKVLKPNELSAIYG